MLLRKPLIGRQQDDTGKVLVLAMHPGIMAVLQQIDMHKQRLTAAGRILKAKFIQIIFSVRRHVGVIRPMKIESLHKRVEIVQ